jgi:hypothetical protein
MSSRITIGRNEKAAWILTNTQACVPARTSLCLKFTERHDVATWRIEILNLIFRFPLANNNGKPELLEQGG